MGSADELVKSPLSPRLTVNGRRAIDDQKIKKPTRLNQKFDFVLDQSLALGKMVSLGLKHSPKPQLKHSTKSQLMKDLGQEELWKEDMDDILEFDRALRLPRRNSSTIIKVSSTSDFSDTRDTSSRGTSSRGTSSRGTSRRGNLTWAATPNRSGRVSLTRSAR